MKVSQLHPVPVSKSYFDKDGSNQIPKVSGCYVLCRSDGAIFYIGQAKNIHARIKQHLKNPQKTKRTEFGTASVVWFLEYPKEKLDSLENTWIQSYKNAHCGKLPLLNKVDAPIGL
jgi:excinuclease UvrABC nuclease subunit